MNPIRIITISNRYLLCVGFAVNKFSKKFKIHQRSIQGIITYLLFSIVYIICLYEHYDKQALFETLKDLSKTMYYSLYTHLFLGIINVCVILFEIKAYSGLSNQVLDALPKNGGVRHNFDRIELFVYYKMFVNLVVLICLVSYDLTIIDIYSITRSKILLVIGNDYKIHIRK